MLSKEKCPVCNNENSKYLFSVKAGSLIQCINCHLIYYTPQPSIKELEEFYNSESYRREFSESLMSGTEFAFNRYSQFEQVIRKYRPSTLDKTERKLLDIGCGTGDFLAVAESQHWQVTGIEISPKAAQHAQIKIKGNILIGDLLSLDLPDNTYDSITLYHVIEHLIDPITFLNRIYQLLKPNGILFVETPNIGGIGFKLAGKNWSHLIPPEHIIYFNPSSLRFALKETHFENIQTLTTLPQIIESLHKVSPLLQSLGRSIYQLSCSLGIGPTLQAIATKK